MVAAWQYAGAQEITQIDPQAGAAAGVKRGRPAGSAGIFLPELKEEREERHTNTVDLTLADHDARHFGRGWPVVGSRVAVFSS